MKKHNLYFEIKKNLVFSQLSFFSKSFYGLGMIEMIDKCIFGNNNLKSNKVMSET